MHDIVTLRLSIKFTDHSYQGLRCPFRNTTNVIRNNKNHENTMVKSRNTEGTIAKGRGYDDEKPKVNHRYFDLSPS
jgi:hypothetical protein